jgi:hypothetical protein
MDQTRQTYRPATEWLSAHMRRRCAQRGTNGRLLLTLSDWADVEISVGRGATALSLSREAALEMRAEGISAGDVERALRRVVVQAGGQAVTVITGYERRGRHYRRRIHPGSDRGQPCKHRR